MISIFAYALGLESRGQFIVIERVASKGVTKRILFPEERETNDWWSSLCALKNSAFSPLIGNCTPVMQPEF